MPFTNQQTFQANQINQRVNEIVKRHGEFEPKHLVGNPDIYPLLSRVINNTTADEFDDLCQQFDGLERCVQALENTPL